MIRVVLPYHLQQLAQSSHEIELNVHDQVTIRSILDTLEIYYPMLRGTVRDTQSGQRRNFIRFFACGEDLSHNDFDSPLPESIANGYEAFMIVGAMAGG